MAGTYDPLFQARKGLRMAITLAERHGDPDILLRRIPTVMSWLDGTHPALNPPPGEP